MMTRNHMEAIAPEIKKGVKMSLHHSRDTAQKQVWNINICNPYRPYCVADLCG